MKQKTRIASKLFAALVVLTLISCCFLGTTMARYTSAGTGTATVQVAKWDVSVTNNVTELTFGDLSPDMEGTAGNRTHSTGRKLVATVTNGESDVTANVTINLGKMKYNSTVTFEKTASTVGAPTVAQLENLFEIKLYYNTENNAENANSITISEGGSADMKTIANNTTWYIYAEVIWKTDDTNTSETNGWYGDKLDTFVGRYVTEISWSLSYTAVQASELPPTPSTP